MKFLIPLAGVVAIIMPYLIRELMDEIREWRTRRRQSKDEKLIAEKRKKIKTEEVIYDHKWNDE